MIDAKTLASWLRTGLSAQSKTLKGPVYVKDFDGAGPFTTFPIDMTKYNAIQVRVTPPSGSGISADVHVQGSFGGGLGIDLSDPNAVQTGITRETGLDVVVGTLFCLITLTNIVGIPDAGQQWRVTSTPYVAPSQTHLVATVL